MTQKKNTEALFVLADKADTPGNLKEAFQLMLPAVTDGLVLALLLLCISCGNSLSSHILTGPVHITIQNFRADGSPVVRTDAAGQPIDAHDGGIFQDPNSGNFYLYGTAYGCGFQWYQAGTPFCGFRVYSSTDLVNWTARGLLFDPATWQTACGARSDGGGCFRPRMLYNRATSKFVLWFTGPGLSPDDYWSMTCTSPIGPCSTTSTQPQTLARSNLGHPSDINVLQDTNGTAYIVYNSGDSLWIEQLDASYLYPTGTVAQIATTEPGIEAPAVFVRNGVFYALYGRYCGFCLGTDTSYSFASTPLGPWTAGEVLSSDSCGGQSSNVAAISVGNQPVFLFESDLWLGTPNEAAASRFDAPLTFSGARINSLECSQTVALP